MPYLRIETNVDVEGAEHHAVLQQASELLARELGKPERYVMIALDAGKPMLLAGSAEPLAYLQLSSIGLPAASTAGLSKALCGLLAEVLGIRPERVYIVFADIPRQLWGWNGGTF